MELANYVGLGILLLVCIFALVYSHREINGRDE
jgi:hypothetical protein